MGRDEHRQVDGGELARGMATFAGAIVDLPAVRASSLGGLERTAAAAVLERAWDLLAFTQVGAALVEVVDAAGARIELVGGVPATWGSGRGGRGGRGNGGAGGAGGIEGIGDAPGLPRVTSHGAVRAAWGAPPGRRMAAMGTVTGPGGSELRLSCALVLRLPAACIREPLHVAATLAFHAAMHAAERGVMPMSPSLATSLAALAAIVDGMPSSPRGRVAWADAVVDLVVVELGGLDAFVGPPLRGADRHVS